MKSNILKNINKNTVKSSGTRDAVETAIDLSKDASGTWEVQLAHSTKSITRWLVEQPEKEPTPAC